MRIASSLAGSAFVVFAWSGAALAQNPAPTQTPAAQQPAAPMSFFITSSGKGDGAITVMDLSSGQVVKPPQVRTQAGYSLYHREPEGLAIQLTGGAPRMCIGFASTRTATSTTKLLSVYYMSKLV